MQTLQVNIQVDDIQIDKLPEIQKRLEELFAQWKRRQITMTIYGTMGEPIAERK